jgi:hypothetical protein
VTEANEQHDALADCMMPLKYGRLPDALRKVQQLQKIAER